MKNLACSSLIFIGFVASPAFAVSGTFTNTAPRAVQLSGPVLSPSNHGPIMLVLDPPFPNPNSPDPPITLALDPPFPNPNSPDPPITLALDPPFPHPNSPDPPAQS